jgi:hypothetical protein
VATNTTDLADSNVTSKKIPEVVAGHEIPDAEYPTQNAHATPSQQNTDEKESQPLTQLNNEREAKPQGHLTKNF